MKLELPEIRFKRAPFFYLNYYVYIHYKNSAKEKKIKDHLQIVGHRHFVRNPGL